MHIDKLVINGKIYTMADEGDTVEAIAIDKGIILETGNTVALLDKYMADEIVDLEGKVVVPGLGDSHMHFYAYCQSLTTVDLGAVHSKKEALDLLRERAEELPEGTWVRGSNFDQSKWVDCNDSLPTREDLDKVSEKHPILIKRVCLHTAVVNSCALQTAGMGKNYRYCEGGYIELDKDGTPTGIVRERATGIFDALIPDPMEDKTFRLNTMAKALEEAGSVGLTRIHTYAAEIWKYFENIDDYRELNREGLLPLRVTVCLDKKFKPEKLDDETKKNPYNYVKLGSYKLFSDGSLGSRSAALFSEYDDDRGNFGIMVMNKDEMQWKVFDAYVSGLQPAIHCIGDKGLDSAVSAIEYTLDRCRREKIFSEKEISQRLPFRLIHAQMSTPELTKRMRRLPVVLDVQPAFLFSDIFWIEERIGKQRAAASYTWKTFKDKGIPCLGGSDSPVESFSPILGIYAAVTRKDLYGKALKSFHPEEALTVYEALSMFTKNISIATGEEEVIGTIEKGKFADLAILDRDIFTIERDDIKNIKVLGTYLAGKEVFSIKQKKVLI